MKKAKVVHLASAHSPFDTRVFHRECRSLARAGYEVTLIAPHDHDEMVDGVRIRAIPKSTSRIGRMTRSVWHVCREAVRQRADVYHFHDLELIPAGLFLQAWGKKVVYDIHEDYPRRGIFAKYCIPGWRRPPLGWLAERAENAASGWFSALVPVTPAIAERFKALNRNTVVVHNFPSLGEFGPIAEVPWSQRACSVAFIGQISTIRGIREIVEATRLLPERLNATLELAGTFRPASLRGEVAQLPGWKRVNALGEVDRTGVAEVLGRVRAGLVVFHPQANQVPSMPNKMFEYMALAIPVIASDFPLWREIIQGAGCGLLVDPLNPKAIAEAIEYVLTHPEQAKAMGRRGREAVEKRYNWENEERKLLQLYAGLVETG